MPVWETWYAGHEIFELGPSATDLVRRAARPLAANEVLRVGDLSFDVSTYLASRAGVPRSGWRIGRLIWLARNATK